MYRSLRTMPQFHCVELSDRGYDSTTGRGEKASIEHLFVAGHLRDTVGPDNE